MNLLKIAIAGCGQISTQYGHHLLQNPQEFQIIGAFDLDPARAQKFTTDFGGKVYEDFDAILADPEVDIVVNLTIHHAHFELNARALRAGKHVFTEKPMALTYAQASELIHIAKETGRRLGCAPTTFLGAGVQTTARFLRDQTDKLGTLRVVYAEVNWGQINTWIGSPAAYFSVGPLLDVGVYAITAMTFLLGPVRRVWGYSTIVHKERLGSDGTPFTVTAPDFTTGVLEFESGVIARLTTNYYIRQRATHTHLRGMEFHGDKGSFILSDYHNLNATCTYLPYNNDETHQVPLLRDAPSMDRTLGLLDMAAAIRENRPHLGSAEHAAHVVEIMEALQKSSDQSQYIEITSKLDRPPIVPWAETLPLHVTPPTT